MFESLFRNEVACRRHYNAPFAKERERYLRYCASVGGTHKTLRVKAIGLLRIARQLDDNASGGVDMPQLEALIRRCGVRPGATLPQGPINIGRPWLRFLGWWRTPVLEISDSDQLDRFVAWMRDERGFSPLTISQWGARATAFLRWCWQTHRSLCKLQPADVDQYFRDCAARWSRISARHMAAALRAFLHHAASQDACTPRLAETIRSPRVYKLESLPIAPTWSQVQHLLDGATSDRIDDVRARAILMLLAIYGMRRGEVASLRLDQIDWGGRLLRLFRLKRRQAQAYPLLPSVAQALAMYIDTVRPHSPHPEVFIGMLAPRRPITPGGIYNIVHRRFLAAGIQLAHLGPHALRHACATRLMAEGLTLKEIGDHLGHRSTAATSTYTKVDLASLREVGDFDLGGMQ